MKAPPPAKLYNVVLYYGKIKQGVLHYNLHYPLAMQKRNELMAGQTINATRRVHIEPVEQPKGKTKPT